MTFLGVHAGDDRKGRTVSLSSEMKRRSCAKIFIIDKVVASFTGRPPLLSRRYVSTPLPLDLSDDILFEDKATIRRAVQALDENGWNTDNLLHGTTILRARQMMAFVRDEIFEIALSKDQEPSVDVLL